MTLHPHSSVTGSVFECIQKPLIGLVIPQKKLGILREQVLLSHLKNLNKDLVFSIEDFDKIICYAIKIKDQIQDKKEVQKQLNKLYVFCMRNFVTVEPKQIFMKNKGDFDHIEQMIADSLKIARNPDYCIFDYSLFLEMLSANIIYPEDQNYYVSLMIIARTLVKQRELSSPEYFSTLIYTSFFLKKINEFFLNHYKLEPEFLLFIDKIYPGLVCAYLKEREFDDKKLNALKYLYSLIFDLKNNTLNFDPIEYRKQMYALMEDDNYMNFMIIWESFHAIQKFQGFAISIHSRFEIMEKLLAYIAILDGDVQGQYYNQLFCEIANTLNAYQDKDETIGDLINFSAKCIDFFMQFVSNKNHTLKQQLVLVSVFPKIIGYLLPYDSIHSKNKIFKGNKFFEFYQLCKLKAEELLQMKKVDAANIKNVNESIYTFIQLLPAKQQAAFLNEWMKSFMNIGKSTGKQTVFLAQGRILLETAHKDGIYSKNNALYDEACVILNLKTPQKKLTNANEKKKK